MDIDTSPRRLSRAERGVPENWVTIQGHEFAPDVAPYVQAILRDGSLKVLSGHRDERENREQHGVDRSYHRWGRAVDLVGGAEDMARVASVAGNLGAVENHMENVNGRQHLHLAWAGDTDGEPI